jgi:NAD+ kinase
MKAIIFGEARSSVETLVKESGFELVDKDPDFVISYGGDGTLMRAEALYPEVPKILLRNSAICKKCSHFSNEEVLQKILSGSYRTEKLIKLEAESNGKKILGANDIIVHNQNPRYGIRYTLTINDRPYTREVIGDGIVVSTPFGSTGYYRSITDSFFEIGMGLAFNNSTEQADHMVLEDNSVIELTVTRGPAEVFADNDPESIVLNDGDKVTIKKSPSFAQIAYPV